MTEDGVKVKEPPPKTKYNQNLDKSLLTAELIARHTGDGYRDRDNMLTNINTYLRDGFPQNLLAAINNPEGYHISPVLPVLPQTNTFTSIRSGQFPV